MNCNHSPRWSAAVVACMCCIASGSVQAADDWSVEFTPNLWAAGLKADIVVAGQSGEIDMSFSDLLEDLEVGGAFWLAGNKGKFAYFAQVDYLETGDYLEPPAPSGSNVDVDQTIVTLGVGRRFKGAKKGKHLDLLVGVRYAELQPKMIITGLGSFDNKLEVTDPLIIVRPSVPLSARWRFNSTMAIGVGGDSDEHWEMQPNLQFEVNDRMVLRFGYRRLHYENSEGPSGSFDGDFEGLIAGLGWIFGPD